jgi:hypothetical protein
MKINKTFRWVDSMIHELFHVNLNFNSLKNKTWFLIYSFFQEKYMDILFLKKQKQIIKQKGSRL